MNDFFRKFAAKISEVVGTPWAFAGAVLIIIAWAASGPIFGFSDTWQLVINTGTTIVTFLMVFLIQNAQNRDARALHLKLDELIRAMSGARNSMVDIEDLSDEELRRLHDQFQRLRRDAGGEVIEHKKVAIAEELGEREESGEKHARNGRSKR